jgi:hypothetical protein
MYLIATGTWLKVLIGQIHFFHAQRALPVFIIVKAHSWQLDKVG